MSKRRPALVMIGVRVDPRDVEALTALADAAYEDLSPFIRRILHDYVATHDGRECP